VSPGSRDWHYNLLARPEVTIETVAGTFSAVAAVATGTRRTGLLGQQAAEYPLSRTISR
jgi:hypothetical protein